MTNELTRTEAAALNFAAKAAAAKDNDNAAWFARTANRKAAEAGTTVEALIVKAAAIEAAAVVEVPAAPVAPAACSVKAIRRFFAICKSAGIDTGSDDRMKGALSAFLGRKVASRKELSTDDWLRAGDAIERAALVF